MQRDRARHLLAELAEVMLADDCDQAQAEKAYHAVHYATQAQAGCGSLGREAANAPRSSTAVLEVPEAIMAVDDRMEMVEREFSQLFERLTPVRSLHPAKNDGPCATAPPRSTELGMRLFGFADRLNSLALFMRETRDSLAI